MPVETRDGIPALDITGASLAFRSTQNRKARMKTVCLSCFGINKRRSNELLHTKFLSLTRMIQRDSNRKVTRYQTLR